MPSKAPFTSPAASPTPAVDQRAQVEDVPDEDDDIVEVEPASEPEPEDEEAEISK